MIIYKKAEFKNNKNSKIGGKSLIDKICQVN